MLSQLYPLFPQVLEVMTLAEMNPAATRRRGWLQLLKWPGGSWMLVLKAPVVQRCVGSGAVKDSG